MHLHKRMITKLIVNLKLGDNLDIKTNNTSFNKVNVYVKEPPHMVIYGINFDESICSIVTMDVVLLK